MKVIIPICAWLMLSIFNAHGQEEELKLLPGCKAKSPFTRIHIIDNITGKQDLGYIQKGMLNRPVKVVFKGNLGDSIARYFIAPDTVGKEHKELVIILNEIVLGEMTTFGETGRLKISIRLFTGREPDHLTELMSIDSVHSFGGMDVTKRLLNSVSFLLCGMAGQATEKANLQNVATENLPVYSLPDLHIIDSLEKMKIPVYNTAKIKPGIYYNYQQFKMNTPDSSVLRINVKNNGRVDVLKLGGKKMKPKSLVDNNTVYAVCDGTTTYRATTIGFYEIQKINSDFYFAGETAFTKDRNTGNMGANSMFGIIGSAIANKMTMKPGLTLFKINYLKGNSIPLRVME